MNKIQIIMNLNNDYNDIKLSIESLLKYTDFDKHELIVTVCNNCNNEIVAYLRSLDEKNIKIVKEDVYVIINNSDSDIIILDSDTVVTKNWVEKIRICAYSDDYIGIVTPLSNNEFFDSKLDILGGNSINNKIDSIAELVDIWSLKEYPTLDTINRNCMFIKREFLSSIFKSKINIFECNNEDIITLNYLMLQSGYRNVLCDNLFIYNKNLIKNSDEINLHNKHFEYILSIAIKINNYKKNILYLLQEDFREDVIKNAGGTQLHVKDLMNGLKYDYNIFVLARDEEYFRLTIYIEEEIISYKFFVGQSRKYPIFTDKKQKELYCNILKAFSIDIVHIHHTLGLSLDLYYEAKELSIPVFVTIHDFYYVCPSIKLLNHNGELCIGNETKNMCAQCLKKQFEISDTVDYISIWRHKNLEALELCDKIIVPSKSAKDIFTSYFSELAEKIQIIEHGSDIYEESIELDKDKLVISENCKYYIENLFDEPNNNKLINGWIFVQELDSSESGILIQTTDERGVEKVFKAKKQPRYDVSEAFGEKYLYSGFSLIVPPKIFKQGKLAIKLIILNNNKFIANENIEFGNYFESKLKNEFRVAFIGGMSPAKGSQIAYNMIKSSSKKIKWYVFGGIGDKDLNSLNRKNLVKTGAYEKDELYSLIKSYEIDLVCILPIWPETFCYTLSEALLCGVPVIVTDMGAVGERVKEMNCGWIIQLGNTNNEILNLLNYIKDNYNEYKEKLDIVHKVKIRSISDMTTDYKQIYSEFRKNTDSNQNFDSEIIYNGYCLENDKNFKFSDEQKFISKLYQLELELKLLHESNCYNVIMFFRRLKIPFKRQIKFVVITSYKILKKLKEWIH